MMGPRGYDEVIDKYHPILLLIEITVIQAYEQNPTMSDYNVDKVYEGLYRTFEKELKGRKPPRLNWKDMEEGLFEHLMLESRKLMGEAELDEEDAPLEAFLEKEAMVMIYKRLRKSIELWSEYGRQGYLNYILRFLAEMD